MCVCLNDCVYVYDYLCITVCVLLFIGVHVNDFVCVTVCFVCVCVCLRAFMLAFVLKY